MSTPDVIVNAYKVLRTLVILSFILGVFMLALDSIHG